jgi:hypothetical protein
MWLKSWNQKGYTRLYYDKSDKWGYYIGTESLANKTTEELKRYTAVSGLSRSDTLYFPVMNASDDNGWNYWLATSACDSLSRLMYVSYERLCK